MHLQLHQKVKFKVDENIGGWSGIDAIVVFINYERKIVRFQKGKMLQMGASTGVLQFSELDKFLSHYNVSLENK